MELKNLSKNIILPKFLNDLYDGFDHTSAIESYSNLKANQVLGYISLKYTELDELTELVKNGDDKICKDVEKIWKRKFKSKAKGYAFDIDQAIYRLCNEIEKLPFDNLEARKDLELHHPSYEETRKRIIHTTLEEYINLLGKEKAYETLSQGKYYNDNYFLNTPLKVINRDFKSPKSVNKEAYSSVISSTFIAYYYYEITIKIGNEEITFLDTITSVCCG